MNIHNLRSYLGLANTLTNFRPDLVQATAKLRKLTSLSNSYTWLDDHYAEFEESKKILTSKLLLQPFHDKWETHILRDASRLHGLGFALMQMLSLIHI